MAAAILVLGGATAASAQSLAEIAKKEEERRKALQKPSKVITGEQVKKHLPPPAAAPAPAPAAPTPAPTPTTADLEAPGTPSGASPGTETTASSPHGGPPPPKADAPPAAPSATAAAPVQDEKYWRQRISNARGLLDRAKVLADAMQSRINALTTEFVARDDPAQRAQLAQDRDRAVVELARLRADVEKFTQSIADIEEEARRAGVPAGWLR
jgi:hypothetical protein